MTVELVRTSNSYLVRLILSPSPSSPWFFARCLSTFLWAVFLMGILRPPQVICWRDTMILLVETFTLCHFHVLFPCVRENSDHFWNKVFKNYMQSIRADLHCWSGYKGYFSCLVVFTLMQLCMLLFAKRGKHWFDFCVLWSSIILHCPSA